MKREPPADPGEGFREFFDLWSAPNAEALHRVLVLGTPVGRGADTFEPFALLERHHKSEPQSSLTTALLLLTDRRWRHDVHRLVRRIADSAILDTEALDLLAQAFIAADDAVYWRVPDEWFAGGAEVVVDVGGDQPDPAELDDGDEGPAVARRDVFPPLRRWAATHLVAREPAGWSALWRRAHELDARGAAAVVAGLLDRIDVIAPPAQAFVITQTTSWPDHTVRRLALDLVAARQGPDAAARLGRADPNARIRAWAASLVPSDQPASSPRGEPPEQSTLF